MRGICRKVGVRLDCNFDIDGNVLLFGSVGFRVVGGVVVRVVGWYVGWMLKRVATFKSYILYR